MTFHSLVLILILSVISSYAASATGDTLATAKSEMLSQIDLRLQKIQSLRSCVTAAADKSALKQCRKLAKEWIRQERHARLNRPNKNQN